MMLFAIYALTAFGLWYVLGVSEISNPLRDLLHEKGGAIGQFFVALLECPGCFGVWTGAAATLIGIQIQMPPVPSIIVTALCTCATNLAITRALSMGPWAPKEK